MSKNGYSFSMIMSSTVGKAMEGRFQKDQNNFTCSIYFLSHPKIVPEPKKMTQDDLKPKNVPNYNF